MALFSNTDVIIKGIKFKEISLNDYELFNSCLKSYPCEEIPWEMNFTYLYCKSQSLSQNNKGKILWKLIDGFIVVFHYSNNKLLKMFGVPLALDKHKDINNAIEVIWEVEGLLKKLNDKLVFFDIIPKKMLVSFDDYKFEKLESDYVYLCEDLINLTGKEYKNRRNMVNNFKKNNLNHVIRPYNKKDKEAVLLLRRKWEVDKQERIKSNFEKLWDKKYFEILLSSYEKLHTRCFVIEVNNSLEGYIFLSGFCHNCCTVINENTNTSIKGLTEYLWYETLKLNTDLGDYENDGGDNNNKGVAVYKQSHRPVFILEKYSVKKRS